MLRNNIENDALNNEKIDLTYLLRRAELLKLIMPFLSLEDIVFLQRVSNAFYSIFKNENWDNLIFPNFNVVPHDVLDFIKINPALTTIIFNIKSLAFWGEKNISIWQDFIKFSPDHVWNLPFLVATSNETALDFVKIVRKFKIEFLNNALSQQMAKRYVDCFFVLMLIKAYLSTSQQKKHLLLNFNVDLFNEINKTHNVDVRELFLDYWIDQHDWENQIHRPFAIAYHCYKNAKAYDPNLTRFYENLLKILLNKDLMAFLQIDHAPRLLNIIESLTFIDDIYLKNAFLKLDDNTRDMVFDKLSFLNANVGSASIQKLMDIWFPVANVILNQAIVETPPTPTPGISVGEVAELIQAYIMVKDKKAWHLGFFTVDIHSKSTATLTLIRTLNALQKDNADDAKRHMLIEAYYKNPKNINRDFHNILKNYFASKNSLRVSF